GKAAISAAIGTTTSRYRNPRMNSSCSRPPWRLLQPRLRIGSGFRGNGLWEVGMQPELVRKMAVEAVGAFALSFIGVGAILYGGPNSLVTVALAHGFVIAVMVCAAGHISGGHFNPAVTFGFLVTKRIPTYEAVGYWVAQLGAAVLGALAVRATLPGNVPNIN